MPTARHGPRPEPANRQSSPRQAAHRAKCVNPPARHFEPDLHDAQRKAILNNIPDQAWLKDARCRYIAVNEAYIAACGVPEAKIVGRLPTEVWPPELAKQYLKTDREVLSTGRRKRYEEQRRDRDGKLRWYETIKMPVRNSHRELVGTVGISRDITDRKVAERELIESRAQLRELSAYLQTVREAERSRISRELHDELGQTLTALRLGLDSVQRLLVPGQERLAARLQRLRELADVTVASVQTIAAELRPVILDDLGLAPAVEWLIDGLHDRAGAAIRSSIEIDDAGYDPEVRTAIFRILQESLTNACRHARARNIRIALREANGCVELVISDDGKGMARERAGRGKRRSLGLLGMRERATMVGGQLAISSEAGRGTTISLRIPLERAP